MSDKERIEKLEEALRAWERWRFACPGRIVSWSAQVQDLWRDAINKMTEALPKEGTP